MMKQQFFLTVLVVISLAALAGCTNTLDGIGGDIESAGQTIQETF